MGRSSEAWINMMEQEWGRGCCGEGCDCPLCYEAGEEERRHREAWFCSREDHDEVSVGEFGAIDSSVQRVI
jgi:hypothetical protein